MTTSAAASHRDPIEVLRAACAGAPQRAEPLVELAHALLGAHRAAEAVVPAEQAVALAPKLAAATAVREAVLLALHASDPTLVKLELQAALDPVNADAHMALGVAYAALDRPHDAERHFKAALQLGRARDAHAELATLYLSVSMWEAVEHHANAALAFDDLTPSSDSLVALACQTLASVAEARGDLEQSARRLDQAYARQSLFRQAAPHSPFTTLILVTRETGNLPYKSLLPPLKFDCAVWYMEHARLEQIAELPAHAVILNAIGDPDVAMASQTIVDDVLARCPRPVLNAPERVRATFRHRIKDVLAGVEDVIVPMTIRLSAEVIAERGLAKAVHDADLTAPIIVRPVGSHGGVGLVLAQNEAALDEIHTSKDQDVYVSRFHDYRSADGYFRKYRAIFVAGQTFPYHLAIGRHWMVHHQSTDMALDASRIAEELEFLRDPARAIGARAVDAIEAIGGRLGLDYGGVDFGVTADGQVLVFETNATMLTHLEPEDGPFSAKNPFIHPIIDAFQARLAALAQQPERAGRR